MRGRIWLIIFCALSPWLSLPAFAQFSSAFPKNVAETAFSAASVKHVRDLGDLYRTRGLPSPAMRITSVADVARFLRPSRTNASYLPKTAILFYSQDAGFLSTWLIDQTGLKAASRIRVSEGQLKTSIRHMRLSLNVDGINRSRVARKRSATPEKIETRDKLDSDLKTLSAQLLPKPIADGLRDIDHVIIISSGAIATVPHAMLKLGQGRSLIDQATVSVSAGLFDVDQMISPWRKSDVFSKPLIVGNPYVPPSKTWDVPPLPGAEIEVSEFGKRIGRSVLTGKDARKDRILLNLPSSSMIYVAAHGVSNPDEPLTGGFLMLSADTSEGGFLTAKEVQSQKLNAYLVVLSACQSGLGMIHDGGVIGLSRSFQKAGAARIVMSLWSVSDEATAYLMDRFQTHLDTDIPAIALRKAMLEARVEYPDPALWAPFTLFGTPR